MMGSTLIGAGRAKAGLRSNRNGFSSIYLNRIQIIALSAALWSCGNSNPSTDNYVEFTPTESIDRVLEGEQWSVLVQDNSTAMKRLKKNATKLNFDVIDIAKNEALEVSRSIRDEEELTVGFPIAALDKKFSFGSVITAVTDDTELGGRLKLTDLPAIPVRLQPERTPDEELFLSLYGCVSDCDEDDEETRIISIPVVGVDDDEEYLVLDLSVLGKGLNLYEIVTGDQNPLEVKAKSAKVSRLDFTDGTLVFDVDTLFEKDEGELDDESEANEKEITITSRWYLLLREEVEAEDFVQRKLREEVGFFDTFRGKTKLATRFATPEESGKKVKYYLKNIPPRYQDSFAAALDSWNDEFSDLLGEDLIEYEFLEKTDPRHERIVAGDVRYNVIEWDLVNVAPYGGLGPSIASQLTGQIYSANTLVQGPSIEKLYQSWFKVQSQANTLIAMGRDEAALQIKARAQANLATPVRAQGTLKLELAGLSFDIKSQRPDMMDDDRRLDFYDTPGDLTYDEYMFGYFKELVGHEVGHNLGLRHNFKGNLGSTGSPKEGEVSRSIMEYLGRTVRHLNSISIYDKMALAYGYAGKVPSEDGWFCTDEDVPSKNNPELSAECSRDDIGPDAYTFFKDQLKRAVTIILGSGSKGSDWSYEQMKREVEGSVNGLSAYASSAEATSDTWTNFFENGDRPTSVAGIQRLVSEDLSEALCGDYIDGILGAKPEAVKSLSAEKLSELRNESSTLIDGFGLDSKKILGCL